ncbi:MAG: hypothetical protein QMD85_03075, partial [Candidatus Aenigmarchaeota archaeon]|nr:hypothetical protein [Candidatus Aenigmarchaeota archaeon]MDI6722514.1 hypothetical protein [Candidatus Aenigmarchaeota archaeon]
AQPVIDGVFRKSKDLKLGRGVADVKYGVVWTPEAFQDERKLSVLFFGEVKVKSTAYTLDPTKPRIGFTGQSHEIGAMTHSNKMTLKASGNYRGQLKNLVEMLTPQYAELNLAKEDAERLLKKVRNRPIGKYLSGMLEKALEPQQRSNVSIFLGGGIEFGTKEVIEIIVPTKFLDTCAEMIGEPLLDVPPKQETQITELIKYYGILDLVRGKRLYDLQMMAREIPSMDLKILYGHPLLTYRQAKKMLREEIRIISEAYENMFYFGMNTHMIRGGVVKRLAREHFGDEAVKNFDEISARDYIDFLRGMGYEPPQAFEKEPDYITKERHLLEFFKQSYHMNPQKSIDKFRDYYQNSEPKMSVFATSGEKDASRSGKLKIPEQSRLYSFGITEHMKRATPYSNDLSISRTLPTSDNIHFWSRTSLDSPILLPLQEYACRDMGINFRY